jgi:hypothetical protein
VGKAKAEINARVPLYEYIFGQRTSSSARQSNESASKIRIGCERDAIISTHDQFSHPARQNFTVVVTSVYVADPNEDERNIPGINGTMRPIRRYERAASRLHINCLRFSFAGFKEKKAFARLRVVDLTPVPSLVKMAASHEELFADAAGIHGRRAKAYVGPGLDKLQNIINDNVAAGLQDCIEGFLIPVNAAQLVEAFRIPPG